MQVGSSKRKCDLPAMSRRGFITGPLECAFLNSSIRIAWTSSGVCAARSGDALRSDCPSLTSRSMIGCAIESLIPESRTASVSFVTTFGNNEVLSCWTTCSRVVILDRGVLSLRQVSIRVGSSGNKTLDPPGIILKNLFQIVCAPESLQHGTFDRSGL